MACLDTPFSITAAVSDERTARVAVVGEIDPASVGTFSTVLHTLADDGVRHFIIDASGLTFVDSMAIQAMLRLLAAGDGVRITLRAPSHRFLDLLLATGLDSVVTIESG